MSTQKAFIPFNRPCWIGKELTYITQALASGHISGDGLFSKKCHQLLKDVFGVREALLTTSGTHALEMAALLLRLGPEDEVIVPSYAFVSLVTAIALRGARPVFVDIRPDTLNIDETLIEKAITPHTKAIFIVHYGGVGCEMDKIMNIAKQYRLSLIEDNAHGLFGKYKGRYLGTFGSMAAQSFHETKNFTCGEGGALLMNHPDYIERAYIIREKGTNRTRFFQGQVDKYSWIDIGSSYLPSDILAAILYAQLEEREKIQNKRRSIWHFYLEQLKDWAAEFNVQLPFVPDYCEQTYHLFYLILPSSDLRNELIAHLKAQGILSVFHYLPLHLSEMGQRFGGRPGDCPVTEDFSERIVRLPFYYDLIPDEQYRIVTEVMKLSRAATH